MDYSNLGKQLGPKKAIEALSMVKDIKEKKSEAKKGVDLASLTRKLAEKKLEAEKEDEGE